MIAFAGLSQNPDTINLNKQDALRKLGQALTAKVYKEERDSLRRDILSLNKLIEIKQLQIDNLTSQTQDYVKLIDGYNYQIKIMREQRQLIESQVDNLTTLYRKERRKKTFWQVVCGIALGGGIYLGTQL